MKNSIKLTNLKFTIYDTPIVIHIIQGFAILLTKILGWKRIGKKPLLNKYVLIAAPHTSNWDMFYGFLNVFASRNKIFFMAKHTLFKGPFRPILKWLGGIPIDRRSSHHIVASAIDEFKNNDNLVITVPPEGTRSKIKYWKSGFYHIANNANVPILLGFLDYNRKEMGYGPLFMTTGEIEKDMKKIYDFYKNIRGRYPYKETPAVLNIRKIKRNIS